jgi:hypothetical protein
LNIQYLRLIKENRTIKTSGNKVNSAYPPEYATLKHGYS